jgi:hypothetical protein
MKRIAFLSALALCLAMIAPRASAQDTGNTDHGNFGVFFDYNRLGGIQGTHPNMFGVGGRLGFNINPHVALEGEMAYDFERSVTSNTASKPKAQAKENEAAFTSSSGGVRAPSVTRTRNLAV